MAKKENRLIVSSEYHVVVEYGKERLEDCIERMIKDKEKNIKKQNCISGTDSL